MGIIILIIADSDDYTHFSQEGAEKAAQYLRPRYFVRDVRFCNFRSSIVLSESINIDTKISKIYNSANYVFLFKVGQQDVELFAETVKPRRPERVHFDDAVKILKSIQNIEPKIIKVSTEITI